MAGCWPRSATTAWIWDTGSGKLLASLFNGGNEAWAALTPQGFFAASSSKADALLSIVRGLDSISIGQTWQSLYAPDLVREALAGDPDGGLGRASQVTDGRNKGFRVFGRLGWIRRRCLMRALWRRGRRI
jgi:hypothetical protein